MILVEPRGAADRGVARCRASTARRCPSPTATRSAARGAGRRWRRRSAPCRPTRRACGAPTRATPEKCPVWDLHQDLFGRGDARSGCTKGCTTRRHRLPRVQAAGDRRDQQAELAPIRERAQAYLDDPTLVRNIVADGCEKAQRSRRKPCATCAKRWDYRTHERRALIPSTPRSPRSTASRSSSCRTTSTSRPTRSRSSSRPSRARSTCCLPDPQGEPRHPRHPDGGAHAPVPGVRRDHAHARTSSSPPNTW